MDNAAYNLIYEAAAWGVYNNTLDVNNPFRRLCNAVADCRIARPDSALVNKAEAVEVVRHMLEHCRGALGPYGVEMLELWLAEASL